MLRKFQINKLFWGFVILFSCISCFPLIKTSSVPPINISDNNLFESDNERILVLPLWQNYPVVMSEKTISESSTLSFSTPLFLEAKDIHDIHNLIPSKTSAGMILGPGGAIGRGVFFYGILIVSESGNFIWHKPNRNKLLSTKSHFINQEEKNRLIMAFERKSEINRADASNIWFFLRGMKLNINCNSGDRDKIIFFIQNVNIASKGSKPERLFTE